jgi:hypothetical protein
MNNSFRNLVVFILILLSLTLVISCEGKVKHPKPDTKPDSASSEKTAAMEPNATGRIKFDNMVHDFCEVAPDSINSCTFNFTNVGDGTLTITQTRGTCKCTVPDLQKKDYAAGESGQLNVQFHAPSFQGPTSQNIIVSSNDAENPRVELTVRADVRAQVVVTPDSMTLSLTDANNAGAVPITLKSIDKKLFAITSVTGDGIIAVDFDPNKMSDTYTVYPKVNMENLRKFLGGYIVFNINHPECKSVRVSFACLKEFEASPAVVIVKDANAGQVQKRTIYLTSNYNQPIEIESITSDKSIIKVVGQEQTANRFKIDVEITPPPKEAASRVFSDTLHIKIKNKEEIPVQCRGFYKLGQ